MVNEGRMDWFAVGLDVLLGLVVLLLVGHVGWLGWSAVDAVEAWLTEWTEF